MAIEAKTVDTKASEAGEVKEARLAEEIQEMKYEPLLPVEKQLITWSLILGVVLIGFFMWVSYTFFPGQ